MDSSSIWHKKNPKRCRQYRKNWELKNPEKRREHKRKWKRGWYARNAERARELTRLWNKNNRELANKRTRQWRSLHPDKRAEQSARRYAHKLRNGLGCPIATKKVYERAKELRRWFDVAVDHIIPLTKGGRHSVENLQIIYRIENLLKNNRLDYVPKVVFK